MFEMCYYALHISLAENFNLDKSTASHFHLIFFFLLLLETLALKIHLIGKKTKQLVEVSYLKTGKAQSSWDDPSRSFASHGYNTKHES